MSRARTRSPMQLLAAALALLTSQLAVDSQTVKPPACLDVTNAVCNAVLHFHDKVIDQGQYCAGCDNCGGDAVPLNSDNSFVWRHFEHPDLRVQFLKCGQFPPKRRCAQADVAAIFVSPTDSWNPTLRELACTCPIVDDGTYKVPLYQLRSWKLQGDQWIYEFTCPIELCLVQQLEQQQQQQLQKQQQQQQQLQKQKTPTAAAAGRASPPLSSQPTSMAEAAAGSAVCTEKRQSAPDAAIAVTFKCTCPPGYHCVINDVVLKADDSPAGKAAGSGGAGAEAGDGAAGWRPLVVRRCQRVVMLGINGTDEAGAAGN